PSVICRGGPPAAAAAQIAPSLANTSRRESRDHERPPQALPARSNRALRPSPRISHSSLPRNAATKRPSGDGRGALQPPAPKVSCASPRPDGSTEYSCETAVRELTKTIRLGCAAEVEL